MCSSDLQGIRGAGARPVSLGHHFHLPPLVEVAIRQPSAISLEFTDGPLAEVLFDFDLNCCNVLAADNLGELGPTAKSAADALRALAKDKSPRVQEHAADALKQIEGKTQRR